MDAVLFAAPTPTSLEIATSALAALIGRPDCPHIVDVRTEADFAADPVLLPCAVRRSHQDIANWSADHAAKSAVVVVCQQGHKLSHGAAAWLRLSGVDAVVLAGGFKAWRAAGAPTVTPVAQAGLWVTRTRPVIDRIACPWLIRRFVDRTAKFLFVPEAEVSGVADRFGALAFDVPGAFWGHRGTGCSFDTLLAEFSLHSPALDRLATIVRAADTHQPEQAPEAAGLLAASQGLARLYAQDLAQLEAGMALYDAFFAACCAATTTPSA
jgi:rhodanese-related sulfurtransferase